MEDEVLFNLHVSPNHTTKTIADFLDVDNGAGEMKTSLLVAAVVAFGLFASVVAVPIGCQQAGAKSNEAEGVKGGSESNDAEAAVLNRLARKIDELRKLKVATLKSEAKKDGLSIPSKSVKKEMGEEDAPPTEGPKNGGDLADVTEGEEEKKHEQEKESKEAEKNSVSLRTVVRMSSPGSSGPGSFLTDDEQKGLAEYVRVKMLKGTRDVIRMPMEPVIRQHIPSTLSRLASTSEFLSKQERESLSRLVRSNGIKIDGATENDVKLGAFVRAALTGDKTLSFGVKAEIPSDGVLSQKEAEKMSLTI